MNCLTPSQSHAFMVCLVAFVICFVYLSRTNISPKSLLADDYQCVPQAYMQLCWLLLSCRPSGSTRPLLSSFPKSSTMFLFRHPKQAKAKSTEIRETPVYSTKGPASSATSTAKTARVPHSAYCNTSPVPRPPRALTYYKQKRPSKSCTRAANHQQHRHTHIHELNSSWNAQPHLAAPDPAHLRRLHILGRALEQEGRDKIPVTREELDQTEAEETHEVMWDPYSREYACQRDSESESESDGELEEQELYQWDQEGEEETPGTKYLYEYEDWGRDDDRGMARDGKEEEDGEEDGEEYDIWMEEAARSRRWLEHEG